MECVHTSDWDSYTRYRTAAAAAMRVVHERAGVETVILAMLLAAFWGYVFYVALQVVV